MGVALSDRLRSVLADGGGRGGDGVVGMVVGQ